MTLTNGSGNGVADTPVTIDGAAGESCGRGCFTRAVPGPGVDGRGRRYDAALRRAARTLRPAAAEVNRLRRDYNALKSVVIDERLSSGPGSLQVSRFREEAPGNMAYVITDDSNTKLIGDAGHRDRRAPLGQAARRQWITGAAVAADAAEGLLDGRARNAYFTARRRDHVLRPVVPGLVPPALRPETGHVLTLQMVATAHFMHHRYSGFDRPVSISPPPSR